MLYKTTSNGKVQEWDIEVSGNRYRTIVGQKKKITSNWTVCVGKNIGKSNETTPEQQAMIEAAALRKKKLDKDYTESPEVKSNFIRVMEANTYNGKITYPVYIQPKLDGIRAILVKGEFYSKTGKRIQTCPHLETQQNMTLDGELYEHGKDFDEIRKNVLSAENTDTQYWVYDLMIPGLPFKERNKILQNLILPGNYVKVPTFKVDSADDADVFYKMWLSQGYEGMIYRKPDGHYEQKRSKNLVKRKEFKDAEFPVLNICEGNGNKAGMAGYVVTETRDGKRFTSGIKGNKEFATNLLLNKHKFIGGEVTIKYFEETSGDVPRFPVAIRFHENTREF